jgi:hypothetical protein
MAEETKLRSPHMRITVGLPNLQDQLRLVDRLSRTADEHEVEGWEDLGHLLNDLYTQLQHQKQVTIYRIGNRNRAKTRAD